MPLVQSPGLFADFPERLCIICPVSFAEVKPPWWISEYPPLSSATSPSWRVQGHTCPLVQSVGLAMSMSSTTSAEGGKYVPSIGGILFSMPPRIDSLAVRWSMSPSAYHSLSTILLLAVFCTCVRKNTSRYCYTSNTSSRFAIHVAPNQVGPFGQRAVLHMAIARPLCGKKASSCKGV